MRKISLFTWLCSFSIASFAQIPPPDTTAFSNKRLAPSGGATRIEFVGNGDIQKAISQGVGLEANTGLGVIFFQKFGKDKDDNNKERVFTNIEFDFVINIASTSDSIGFKVNPTTGEITNRREFGTYIINPVNSRQATAFNFNAYFNNERHWGKRKGTGQTYSMDWFRNLVSGFQCRFIASNMVWYNDNDTSVNLAGFLLRAGFFHEFIPDDIRISKGYSIVIGVNYSYRGILGDIRSDNNTDLRNRILGTKRTRYNGYEFNLAFRFRNIRAEVQIPVFKNKDAKVPGLTNAQFITSIRFVGGFPLKLKDDENDAILK